MDVGRSPSVAAAATTSDTVDPSPDSEKLKRKRQPRNSACQGCAALKMKCIAGANGKCERCNRMGRDCVPAIPKPRKRRAPSTSRLASPKAIPLSDILSNDAGSSAAPTSHYSRISSRPPDQRDETPQEHHRSRAEQPPPTESKSFELLFVQRLGIFSITPTPSGELLRGIDYQFVLNAFTIFRKHTHHFPFVEISPGADVISMVTQRPILTLAVCIVTSSSRPDVQDRLRQAFCVALASKTLLAGERSMDLLTGLLVYIAWHHHYTPQQQIYQQLSLLAGMVADLGLYSHGSEQLDLSMALERDRAFIGAYYLCSGLSSSGFDKPSPLRWTDNLKRCAENARHSGHLPSDRTLVSILELTRAVDVLDEFLQLDDHSGRTSSSQSASLHIKVANQHISALKRDYPSLNGSLGFSAATIHVMHKNLRPNEPPDQHVLVQCACAIKDYIDDLLLRPPSTLYLVSVVDWTNFLANLLLLAQISDSYPTPTTAGSSWENTNSSIYLKPDQVLESIYAHMASLPPDDPLTPRNDALLRWFRNFCSGVQKHASHHENKLSSSISIYGAGLNPINTARPSSASSSSAAPLFRPEKSKYDTHSTSSNPVPSAFPLPPPQHPSSSLAPASNIEGRFRPLTDQRPQGPNTLRLPPPPTPSLPEIRPSKFPSSSLGGKGILEEGFLSNLMGG